ncbi:CYFA0S29e00562g1_1 [Cyberlindnera fabianii]|uniref:CYFA0S29e00562g1_1 n=1 Tax=Cyberlindnera fabianii TaxID=36022 RepID=A0A061BB21_CYBFA|nr:Na(+)/H(+) antiporter 1 [Cyberlindnera fabianii]CDR47135.1 CYFA0S29e00562g1_1 [Cyberlindnera fabianii]
MAVWSQLDVHDQTHRAYAIIGVCSTLFCLFSLVLKERLFIGEAITSTICGIIVGPHALNWIDPLTWGNTEYITQEVSRVVLIIQIFAISVELPRKYMKTNWVSVLILLCFTMILGWLVTSAFAFLLFPRLNFAHSLAVTAAITATDPVLAAAIVGKGKFGERVPSYLKHLISAESGANDGLAFPFVLLAVNLLTNRGHPGIIVRDWICVSLLWECVFGVCLGVVIGFVGRKAMQFCENRGFIDRESLLVIYIMLSLICTGFGTILGVDDLLVSFAAGGAFAWNGWFTSKIDGQYLSNAIDLLLNTAYFLYFGTIIPWSDFNNHEIGLDWWRLVIWALVVIFLRRIPAVIMAKPFVPAITTWSEAVFVGHFGPIGVGGIFCCFVTKTLIEAHLGYDLGEVDIETTPYYIVLRCIWPIVSFTVVTSIIIHGFSVTLIVLFSDYDIVKVRRKQRRGSGMITSGQLTEATTMVDTIHLDDLTKDGKQRAQACNTVEVGEGSSTIHQRPAGHRRVLVGSTQSDDLKFFRIGHELIVEDANENFIKKYRLVHDDDHEMRLQGLDVGFETSSSNNYDEEELRACILEAMAKQK